MFNLPTNLIPENVNFCGIDWFSAVDTVCRFQSGAKTLAGILVSVTIRSVMFVSSIL